MAITYAVLMDDVQCKITLKMDEVKLRFGGSVQDAVITHSLTDPKTGLAKVDPIRYCTLRASSIFSPLKVVVDVNRDGDLSSYALKFTDKNSRDDFQAKFNACKAATTLEKKREILFENTVGQGSHNNFTFGSSS